TLLPHGLLGTSYRDLEGDRSILPGSQSALYLSQPRTERLECRYPVLACGLVLLQLPQQVLKGDGAQVAPGEPSSPPGQVKAHVLSVALGCALAPHVFEVAGHCWRVHEDGRLVLELLGLAPRAVTLGIAHEKG